LVIAVYEDPNPSAVGSGPAERVSLYQRYRSRTFAEVVGQQAVTQTLRNAVRYQQVSHSYLFTGPRGTGKTSIARILARAANCVQPQGGEPCNACGICLSMLQGASLDLVEIDGASNNSVDDVRELIARVNFRPAAARRKVFIIDEVHMLSLGAFNALLKTLEEPPEHVLFLLATTELHKVPATILSRCQVLRLRRIAVADMVDRLQFIASREGMQVEPGVLDLLAQQGDGSLRDAVSLLEQIRAYCGDRLELREVQGALGLVGPEMLVRVAEAMASGDLATALVALGDLIADGMDARQLGRQLTSYWGEVLYARARRQNLSAPHVAALQADAIAAVLRSLLSVESPARRSDAPRLALEVAVAEATLSILQRLRPAQATPERQPVPEPAEAIGVSSGPTAELPQPGAYSLPTPTPKEQDPAPLAQPPQARSEESAAVSPPPAILPSPAPEAQVTPGIAEILDQWPSVVRWLREHGKSGSVTAALQSGVVSAEGTLIRVSFSPANTFHLRRLTQQGNYQVLEEAVRAVFGGQWSVRCDTIEGLQAPPTADDLEAYASDLERAYRAQRGGI
jgi:DNA polymerase-3 subunit gamma/tau